MVKGDGFAPNGNRFDEVPAASGSGLRLGLATYTGSGYATRGGRSPGEKPGASLPETSYRD